MVSWIHDKLPPRILTLIISALVFILGYTFAEIKSGRAVRDADIDRMVRQAHPALDTRVVVLEMKMATQEGTTARIENAVKEGNAQLVKLIDAVARVETKLGNKKGGR